jgi:phosphatidate cytidylyltransferase
MLSTVGLWTVVLGTIYLFGAPGGVVLLAVFTLLAQYEFQGLLEKSGLPPWKYATLALGFVLILSFGFGDPESSFWLIGVVLFSIPVALVLGALLCAKDPAAINRLAGSLLSFAYVSLMMVHYVWILDLGNWTAAFNGLGLTIWVIAVAKFTDVGGYLVGSMIGRHKLAPSISPGKTWEGAVGGLLLAALVGYLPVQYAPQYFPEWLTSIRAACLTFPIGIAAIASDLSESAFKRRAGVKDSGHCIPGIGGALDLADSLLLAGPVAFYLFVWVQLYFPTVWHHH